MRVEHPGRGTYALVLHLDNSRRIRIGKLGEFDFRAGYYVYVGSAMGAGGLGGRLKHHLKPALRAHWHIDYLRQAANLEAVWTLESDAPREHEWAALFQQMPGAVIAAPRFGASDCACSGHLFHFRRAPSLTAFQKLATRYFPADGPIAAML